MDLSSAAPLAESEGGAEGFHAIGMLDLLEHDPRPTFLLDGTKSIISRNLSISLAYWNPALADIEDGKLLTDIQGGNVTIITGDQRPIRSEFHTWITTREDTVKSYIHLGYIWTKLVLASQWIVVFGAPTETSALRENAKSEEAILSKSVSPSTVTTFDWTDELPPIRISPHVAWARSINWSHTPLGPMSEWSSQLRSFANLVMQDPRPSAVFYGPDLIMIYNEPYIELLGSIHPCMGISARVALYTVWNDYFEPIMVQNLNGEVIQRTDFAVHIVRNGFMEETYFCPVFFPILDSDGATVGHYEPLAETTRDVVTRRQSETLLQLSEEVPRARDVDSYWTMATEVFSRNDKDVPFILLYSVEYGSSDSSSSTTRMSGEHQQCMLRGSVGLPENSPAGPAHLHLTEDYGFTPYFRQAMARREPITVSFDEDLAAADLVRDVPWQGYGDPCRAAVICPLNPTSSKDNILGFMVIGLNPRRPYDDDYGQFISIASRMLSTSLTSILLHEEDINRRERTIANAEAMRLELKQQLINSQKEVERSIFKFQRFAEGADIGIFILGLDGIYSYRNEAWYNILGADDRSIELDNAWDALIDDEFIPIGQAMFQALVNTKQHQSSEFRLKRTSMQSLGDSEPQQQPVWILCSIFPDMKSDGEVEAMIGSFTDISKQKWGEQVQATHALNAQESKRQLENFIDTTSHEMRNPLSAIVQCADSIISAHKAFGGSMDYQQLYSSILDTTIDSAETIVQCSKHMKTIVDDVLTMSKLDSGLFIMTPVDVQLESVARDAVKMFEGEARSAGVVLEYRLEDSCKELKVTKVSLDPNRALQILINLVTNAIKFTRLEETRHITVSLGIALERPLKYAQGDVEFIRSPEALEASNLQADWEKGQPVYVTFAVQDTGRGLSDHERDLLFARFSQASPRTHIDYGGSGLGLFISRRLTEMHGGAIGFASKAGVGSTFAFYVKSRNSTISRRQSESSAATDDLSIRTKAAPLSNRSRDYKNQSPVQLVHSEIAAADLHVLIVEDNLVNQRVLAKQLRGLGINVTVANHGGEALDHLYTTTYCVADKADANRLSIILMDWEMPVMDGLTCVRRIRELEQQGVVKGHVPVIAVTANVRSEQVDIAVKAGMNNVISKPFRVPELFTCMQETLRAVAQI